MITFGRRKIFTDYTEINESNIEEIIKESMAVHRKNAMEIKYLREYSKGNQPVLERKKQIREDILNNVVVNIAAEILDFKLSYIFGAPLEIIRPSSSENAVDIGPLQRMMSEQNKDAIDQKVALDLCIGGVGYRGVLNNPNTDEESPFCLVQMAPETTFCVYSNDVFCRKMLAVSYIERKDDSVLYTAYTKTHRYELEGDAAGASVKLSGVTVNGIGEVPIAAYWMPEEMGVFEKSLSLLDAYSIVESNRVDDVEQFVQSILAIFGVDLTDEALAKLKKSLCLIVPDIQDGVTPQAKYLTNSMDQATVQSVVDDIYSHILEISAVPGREQSSGGNTGNATELGAGGWRKVQYSAERTMAAWKDGDREMYRIALAILNKSRKTPEELRKIKLIDLETKFTISKSNDLLTKTQSLTTLIQAGVHPRIAIRTVNLFSDPEQTYEESKPYIEKALDRLDSGNKVEDKAHGAVDVTNQPKSEQSLKGSVEGKGVVQKRE